MLGEYVNNPLSRVAVSERVLRSRHLLISSLVSHEARYFVNYAPGIDSDNLARTDFNHLGTLGHLAQHQHWLVERDSFFLYAARVCQYQIDRKSTRLNSSHVRISYA